MSNLLVVYFILLRVGVAVVILTRGLHVQYMEIRMSIMCVRFNCCLLSTIFRTASPERLRNRRWYAARCVSHSPPDALEAAAQLHYAP